jgi:hypothetical protein
MRTHLTVIGAIYTALGAIGLLIAAIAVVSIAGGGLISGDSEAIAITSMVSAFVGALLLVPAIPFLIGGIGLLKGAPWARIVVLVLGCLCLIVVPLGTILGVYTILMLSKPEAAELLALGDSRQEI